MIDKDYERRRLQKQYEIFDEDGAFLNRIVSDELFCEENFKNFVLLPPYRSAKKETAWRNEMLNQTDSLMALDDYPYKEKLAQWRQILRDWPNTESFPETRPVSFDEFLNPSENEEPILGSDQIDETI